MMSYIRVHMQLLTTAFVEVNQIHSLGDAKIAFSYL